MSTGIKPVPHHEVHFQTRSLKRRNHRAGILLTTLVVQSVNGTMSDERVIGMLLVSMSGLVEKNSVEVFPHYSVHLSLFFIDVKFKSSQEK
jgi:hypothetical protein